MDITVDTMPKKKNPINVISIGFSKKLASRRGRDSLFHGYKKVVYMATLWVPTSCNV
jgi:hypothetical protein